MSVELPFAPVDDLVRRNADGLRVGTGAVEALATAIQDHGAALAVTAAEHATADGRKTLMVEDFPDVDPADRDAVTLPIAPVDRIARLDIDDRYRVSMDARVALAAKLEADAASIAAGAATLARHADRRTVQAEDVTVYRDLCE
ncbi:MAG: histone-like protein [Halobacteriaceae archaeon]